MLAYQYIILNYIHDTVRQESINVAMLYFSPEEKKLRLGIRPRLSQFNKIFSNFNQENLKKYLHALEDTLDSYQKKMEDGSLSISKLDKLAHELLPFDASSLQWGKMGSGIAENPVEAFDQLMLRYISKQSASRQKKLKTDTQVWNTFKAELEKKKILSLFEPKNFKIENFQERVDYTYQNGALHCLKAFSLDSANNRTLYDKVKSIKGWHETIAEYNTDPLQFYFLVGAPQDKSLEADFNAACTILSRGENVSVITDKEAASLPTALSQYIH